MGLMNGMMTLLFGDGRNALREAAEVFRPNAEADAQRDAAARAAAPCAGFWHDRTVRRGAE